MTRPTKELLALAKLNGVQAAYLDVSQQRQVASAESLLAALKALRVDVGSFSDVPAALKTGRHAALSRGVEPVLVAWNGTAPRIDVNVPRRQRGRRVAVCLRLEDGQKRRFEARPEPARSKQDAERERSGYAAQSIKLPDRLPLGYHRLVLETGGQTFESLLIAAPRRAFFPEPDAVASRTWGAFLPLYSLQSPSSWGAADFSDLETLAKWTGDLGGGVVGTLPLLPAFLDEQSCDPSPYAPVSRLFWNEFYIDLKPIPELAECAAARKLMASSDVTDRVAECRRSKRVEYRPLMELKRRVLEELARHFFSTRPARFAELQRATRANPHLDQYAKFRATRERQQTWWGAWPSRLRNGRLTAKDYDEHAYHYFLYAQWIAGEQMSALSASAGASGTSLYLDLPLGARSDGYDVWRHQAVFATHASAGAPPDAFFTKGQDWGFPPLHPQAIREQFYQHVIDYLRHHLKFAHFLRIDHVMGLHRLYWIPHGMPANQGAYVSYRPDEFYAILNLESHRHQACVVGENLGTVPPAVNRAMDRHRIGRMHVVQYEFDSDTNAHVAEASPGSVASLNTHDMPTFAAWWNAEDVDVRLDLQLLDAPAADKEREGRRRLRTRLIERLRTQGLLNEHEPNAAEVIRACLQALASSPAQVVLINLEDLWEELRPQNIPGTGFERPNWLRKARYGFEQFRRMPDLVDILGSVDRLRRESP